MKFAHLLISVAQFSQPIKLALPPNTKTCHGNIFFWSAAFDDKDCTQIEINPMVQSSPNFGEKGMISCYRNRVSRDTGQYVLNYHPDSKFDNREFESDQSTNLPTVSCLSWVYSLDAKVSFDDSTEYRHKSNDYPGIRLSISFQGLKHKNPNL